MQIQMQLKDIVRNDELVEQLGLNPYCINEGADPEAWRTVNVESVRAAKE